MRQVYDNGISQIKLCKTRGGYYQIRRRDRCHDEVGAFWSSWVTVKPWLGGDEAVAEGLLKQDAEAYGFEVRR